MDENSPFSIDYDASKAGLINMTKNFAIAFPKLNVNCIAPQWISTQMNDDLGEEYLQNEAEQTGAEGDTGDHDLKEIPDLQKRG